MKQQEVNNLTIAETHTNSEKTLPQIQEELLLSKERIDVGVTYPDIEWDTHKLEYENALSQLRHYSTLGRTDIAFVTTDIAR